MMMPIVGGQVDMMMNAVVVTTVMGRATIHVIGVTLMNNSRADELIICFYDYYCVTM